MENEKKAETLTITSCISISPNCQDTVLPLSSDGTFRFSTSLVLCKLCGSHSHTTSDCDSSLIYYHATNRQNLEPIINDGFIARNGRLGKAVYMSDDPTMCIRFVLCNRTKFPQPILLKVKVMVDRSKIKILKHNSEIRSITNEEFKRENIQAVQCPYYKIGDKVFYELALYKADYAVVSWSHIKLPVLVENKPTLALLPVVPPSVSTNQIAQAPNITDSDSESKSTKESEKCTQKMEEENNDSKNNLKLMQNHEQKQQKKEEQKACNQTITNLKTKPIRKTTSQQIAKKEQKPIKRQSKKRQQNLNVKIPNISLNESKNKQILFQNTKHISAY